MKDTKIENIVEELDFRYGCLDLATRAGAPNLAAERACYTGLTRMLELCGYQWTRDKDGKHRAFYDWKKDSIERHKCK